MAKMKPFDVDELFQSTMKKNWNQVLRTYEQYPEARKAMLTKSKETALHMLVSSYHRDVIQHEELVRKLVETCSNQADDIGIPNDKGNTPLHFAAELGSVEICRCIAEANYKLMDKQNFAKETPFFLAAKHGKLGAFLLLVQVYKDKNDQKEPDESLFRKNDGSNILHAAISGEHFELAYHIIFNYEKLVLQNNVEGSSPLHILATKPSVFKSSSSLRLCDHIIYYCLYVRKLKAKKFATESHINRSRYISNGNFPDNYDTCMNFMNFIQMIGAWSGFHIIWAYFKGNKGSQDDKHHKKDEESQAHFNGNKGSQADKRHKKDEESQENEDSFPPNYVTCRNLFKVAVNIMLIILGIGISRIKKIRGKKEKHEWAHQIMNKLIEHEKRYKYGHDGQLPELESQYAEAFKPPDMPFESDEQGNLNEEQKDGDKMNEEKHGDKPVEKDTCVLVPGKMKESQTMERLYSMLPDAIQAIEPKKSSVLLRYQNKKTRNSKKETPILVAAKMGITEMVKKILEIFPVAIQDMDEDGKNALLLAIENRQTNVFQCLMDEKHPDFVLYQVDGEGNSALHLAATFQQREPWRIPGAALQMQWEIKWYKHVKRTMSSQYFAHCKYNENGETASQIFTRTHEKLLKDGTDWIIKTSESCSVVAALIATVAFATSTTVPGGSDDKTGDPVLKGEPAFDVFSIASLVALCFSVTALVFFLAILTSRCQKQDFRTNLPSKLLFGLTSLFTSIAAILVSFCAGHFFVLKDELHNAAFIIYGITCLPITFFAFIQLPLYFDLLWSILREVPLRSYKV